MLQTCLCPPSPIACCAAAATLHRRTRMTKVQLAARVADQASMSRAGADSAVTADALAAPQSVTIEGFGALSTKLRLAPQDLYPERARASASLPHTARC